MSSLADNISQAISDFDGIKSAIENKGITIPPGTPTSQYGEKIKEIGDGWIRPADRPAVPVSEENEQAIYWLFGVQEDGPNDMAFLLNTNTGDYYVDWGDGTVDTVSKNTRAEHLYDYSTIPGVPNEQGYKWVWIKAYPETGDLTTIDFNQRHSIRPAASSSNIFVPQVFEIYIQAPEVTSMPFSNNSFTRMALLDMFDYVGTNKIVSFTYFLGYCRSLKKIKVDTSNATSFTNFLCHCYSFNYPLDIDTSKCTSCVSFLASCYSFNQPLDINTSGCSNFSSFMLNNEAYNHPLSIDVSKCTKLTSFSALYSLKDLRLNNMRDITSDINISNTSLDTDALTLLFSDLYDRTETTTGTITITDCYGAARLTTEQRAIAVSKNWTIVG